MQDLLSDGERNFIIDGIRTNIRNDGRQRLDVDSFFIELDTLPYCVCSAKVTLHSTQVMVGLKLEVTAPDADLPHQGKIQCSVRYSPCAAPWKRNYELESMNFDLSRELQNIMGNANGMDLTQLCIVKHRLCWIIYVDALILENNGNVFDALCLGSNACFKKLKLPSLNIKNIEQFTQNEGDENPTRISNVDSLFKNTEITKKATISKMKRIQRSKHSKFSGQQLPFQDSLSLHSSITETADKKRSDAHSGGTAMEVGDIAEIDFDIERNKSGTRLKGRDMLPVVVTMAVMDDTRFFIVDPLYEEELCCDVLIRIAVYANGNISIIKYGDKAMDPLLIFNMIESGKQSGLKWMEQLKLYLRESEGETSMEVEVKRDVEWTEEEEKEVVSEMRKQLEALSFITEELRKEKGNSEMDTEESVEHDRKKKKRSDKEEMDAEETQINIDSAHKAAANKPLVSTKMQSIHDSNETMSFVNDSSDDQEMVLVD